MTEATAEPVLSILLPVRDETINLEVMLKLLTAGVEVPHELLVIYDNPNDLSKPVVERLMPKYKHLRLVFNDRGLGIPNALACGIEASRGKYILIVCADDVGPVLALDEMLELMNRGCDFVSGTRYAHGGRRIGGSKIGGFLSRLANHLLVSLSGSVLTDTTTGLKMFRKELFDRLELGSRPVGWVVAYEMGIKAQLLGFKVGEVPIVSVDRIFGGQSTFQLGPWFVEYLKWFIWGCFELRRYRGKEGKSLVAMLPERNNG